MTRLSPNWAEAEGVSDHANKCAAPMDAPKLRIGASPLPLLPPAIFALDACLAWHEMAWHVYSCALDFHAGYMAALGVGGIVTGLWMAALMEGAS